MTPDEFTRIALRRIVTTERLGYSGERRTLDCGHVVDRLPVRFDDDGNRLPDPIDDLCLTCIQTAREVTT